MEPIFGKRVKSLNQDQYGPLRSFSSDTPPRRCRTVAGDGNCLFRALSFWIFGTEDFHYEVCGAPQNVDLVELALDFASMSLPFGM
jgi:hypothetical protein